MGIEKERTFQQWFKENELTIIDSITVILVWGIMILAFTALIWGND